MSLVIPKSTTVLNKTSLQTVPRQIKRAPPGDLPSAFDARDKWQGCLSDPPSQGSCGSCWAFASVTVLQDRFCIASCAPATSVWADLSKIHLCSKSPNTFNAKNENQLYNVADQLFALKKVTIRLLFFQIKAGYGQPVSKDLWASDKPCDQGVLPQITMDEWVTFFQMAYTDMKQGADAKTRSRGLTNIALLELGSPMGFYLPVTTKDTLPVATKKIQMYFRFWDKDKSNKIDLCEFETQKERGPMQLSVEKVIVCLITNTTLPAQVYEQVAEGRIQANAACGGASLAEAWRYLRDSGTPVASCVGYTFQDWGSSSTDQSVKQSQDVLPTCSELLGPDRNQCPGFVPQDEWDSLVNLITTGKEKLATEGQREKIKDLQALSEKLATLEPWNQPLLVSFRALNAYSVAPEVQEIQIEILQNGPVSTGFNVYEDFMNEFGSSHSTGGLGGQKYTGGPALGSSASSLIYKWDGVSQSTGTAHAVVIIGWGVYQDVPFWIVRNSWSIAWGTSGDFHGPGGLPSQLNGGGYFWFVRGINNCGLESNVIAGLPDLAGDAFPGSVIQPSEKNQLASDHDLPPGYNCVYQKNKLVCQELGYHGSSADYEEVNGQLVPIDVSSPLAFFWPQTKEATNKRQALYKEISSYLARSTKLSSLQKEFDTLFAVSSDTIASFLQARESGAGATSHEDTLFWGLLGALLFFVCVAATFWVLYLLKKKKKQ